MREMNRSRDKKFHILTSDWVEESLEEEKMLPERPYEAAAKTTKKKVLTEYDEDD